HVISQGLVAEISGATLWRWLSSDALRPWQHRSWIFPRDPNFAAKAGPVLDLYHRVWEGAPLGAADFVISADEKTSIQARRSNQPTLAPAPNRPTRVEHEYFRGGCLGLPGGLGRPSRQGLRSMRVREWHRTGGSPRQRSHEPGALQVRTSRLLDHG